MILQSKYIEDENGVKYAPVTTPNAVRWPDGSNLNDKLETFLTSHQDISGKEDKMAVVAVSSGTTTLNTELNKYYRFDNNVGTLGITLPSVSGVTELKSIVFSFTTGSSPAVTFTSTGGVSIEYQAYYSIIANTKYEINVLYNGSKWIINYAIID